MVLCPALGGVPERQFGYPAFVACARRAKADPMPLLYICVFVANAARFVLAISNPANLVLYGSRMPALGA